MESRGRPSRKEGVPALQPFGIASRTEGEWTVLDVRGDLDVYSSPTLRHQILHRIDRGDSRIVIDLEHVDFLDSAGVSVMVNGLRRARKQDATLVFAQPGGQVRRMLRLTKLDKALRTFPSVEEAVNAAGREAPAGPAMGAKT
jgi:anti-sigma B factor antagonist